MINRYCPSCKAITPFNKAENRKDSPYICEGCGLIISKSELNKIKKEMKGGSLNKK